MIPNIIINRENTDTQNVQIRNVSSEHYRAFVKLAALHEMTNSQFLSYLVEQELERISESQ